MTFRSNRRKYKNRKIKVNGETFDSKKEYLRFCELALLEKAGRVTDLQRQVKFELIPSQRVNGKVVERPCTYKADFVYVENGVKIVEDVKGFRTPEYRIKKKLMLWMLGIQIKET